MDVFNHFNGGKDGVKARFLSIIQKAMESDTMDLLKDEADEEFGLERGTFEKLRRGDVTVINAELLERLAAPFDFTMDSGFGDFIGLTPDLVSDWQKSIEKDQFVIVGGGNWSPDSVVKMYILTQGINAL
jgi:hypothetical protein